MKIRKIDVTDIEGFHLGNAENPEAGTGCTVIICDEGAVAGVDVKGGGPATRETDLLRSENTVETINAVVLSGGSAFGLEAASGAMRYLRDRKVGFPVGDITVPIVTGASLFDLAVGDKDAFPDVAMGIEACENAYFGFFMNGNHGAGTGATVGKILGMERAMKTGLGTFACGDEYIQVGAISAVNACADVYNGAGNIIAGLRSADGSQIQGCIKVLKGMIHSESEQEISLDDIKAIAKEERSKPEESKEETPEDIAAAMQAAFEAREAVESTEDVPVSEPEPVSIKAEEVTEVVQAMAIEDAPEEVIEEVPEAVIKEEPEAVIKEESATVFEEVSEVKTEPVIEQVIEPVIKEPQVISEPFSIKAEEIMEEAPAIVIEEATEEAIDEVPEAVIEEPTETIPEETAEEKKVQAVEEEYEEELDESDMGYDVPFNTTISCLITNAKLSKPQANKLASILHDAYARAIKPVHSTLDGDTIFVMATGKQEVNFDAFAALATDVMQYAIIDGALSAEGAYGLPASRDIIHK